MIVATQLRVGSTIMHNGDPHKVLTKSHVTPGKGRGMVHAKLRNLKTGATFDNRFRSDEKIERAHLTQHEMEYLYSDGDTYHFMNTETYEQTSLSAEILGEDVSFLIPNVKFMVEYYEKTPVGVAPPKVVELKVVDTAPFMKGATAAASYKPATLETGLVVQVPGFIEPGDVIRVDTAESKYIERAKS
ncbi:MAG: elongation factor P [Thermodesulfobacteriota bacterium]